MLNKLNISGEIETVTGMHIGTGGAYAAIGAEDSPVIRDPLSDLPILPGSSLKGKLRALISRELNETILNDHTHDDELTKRLFGSTEKISRLFFTDMELSNARELNNMNISPTEVKFENSIKRLTSVANPRQTERVIRGAKFKMNIFYNCDNEEQIKEDFEILAMGFKLLENDYIGGSGSRGYGRIKFNDLKVEEATGEIDEALLKDLNDLFKA